MFYFWHFISNHTQLVIDVVVPLVEWLFSDLVNFDSYCGFNCQSESATLRMMKFLLIVFSV